MIQNIEGDPIVRKLGGKINSIEGDPCLLKIHWCLKCDFFDHGALKMVIQMKVIRKKQGDHQMKMQKPNDAEIASMLFENTLMFQSVIFLTMVH